MIRIFRHYISGVYLILFLLELVVFATSFLVGNLLRSYHGGAELIETADLIGPSVVFTLSMWGCLTGMGLYRRAKQAGDAALLLRMLGSFILGSVLMVPFFYVFSGFLVERDLLGYALFYAFIGVLLSRWAFRRFVDIQAIKRRILVLGAGYRGNMIREFESRNANTGFRVIGYVRMGNEPVRVDVSRLLESKLPLNQYVAIEDIDEIVVAPDDRRDGGFAIDELLDCKMAGVDVIDLLAFFEREAGLIRVDCLHPGWLVFSDGFRLNGARTVVKRMFDIVASLLLLLVVWPVLLLAALAVRIESGWRAPILYRQLRVGLNWQLFFVIKLRSMRMDAEKDGKAHWTTSNDRRITRVGHFLRKYRIDELPQLVNVLKGEMSFVGPRPERPEFVEKFAETIPYYSERHRVKPGITGWAQLSYPYGSNYLDAVEKLQYDLYYVKNYSPFLDLLIMLETLEVVLWGKGAR